MTNEDLLKKSREDHETTAKTVSAFREALGRLLNNSEAGSAEAAQDELIYTLYVGFNYTGEHLIRQVGVDRAREIFEQMASRRTVG
ncbi:hypothetical protein UFOVP244_121 [uncultured Caudovirales phage]|uniref:Uncharacterized protein n=1 Tax=uncultured Caudovirales phage TaxID=2100421 RepID=A0A6J7WTH7_9CAUD|nr:hypothetical protein UFOVP244_121 [uncultured Caudovirales phage]